MIKKTWSEIVAKDCLTRKLCKKDAVGPCKWRKLIKDVV